MLHVRFEGKSYDLGDRVPVLDGMNDADVKGAVARFLDVDQSRLEKYVVDRTPTGHVIVRPEALYG